MLRTDVVDLVNTGTAWAFLGSGVSVDAGYPTWRQLVEGTLTATEDGEREDIVSDKRFKRAFQNDRFDICFSVIEKHTDRDRLERAVRAQLTFEPRSAAIASFLSEWPFAAYVTSNYDMLLESILGQMRDSPWIAVGNTPQEIRKVSGEVRDIVWHVHGATGLASEQSHLILTEEDYDNTYLEDSPLATQLRAALTQRRFVFVGFGFNDPELQRLIKLVAKYTSPAQPILAFLADTPLSGDGADNLELLERYNVDVIPYKVVNGSHAALAELLSVYSALILGRSLRFRQPRRPCPSYHPETTGLLVYNQLAISAGTPVTEDALGTLLRARVLAMLRHKGPATSSELTEDLLERTRQLNDPSFRSDVTSIKGDAAAAAISGALAELERLRLIERADGGAATTVELTSDGRRLTDEQAAAAELMSQQFGASLEVRARSAAPGLDTESLAGVAYAAEAFLKDCATRRALGVAAVWHSSRVSFQSYHMVALLQALPRYAEQLNGADDGRALIHVVRSILARPNDTEGRYLGSLMQAHFGLCLMGFDPETVAARAAELSNTLFMLDSTTLIPLLARSSTGHAAATQLLAQIERIGGTAATTDLLAVEVAEHARWALKQMGASKTLTTLEALAAAMGRAGARDNVFVEGCIAEAEQGRPPDLHRYVDSICRVATGHEASDNVFQDAIRMRGISCLAFADWEGFAPELWSTRDKLQAEIGERRRGKETYRHERQVQAESEALLVVQHLRDGAFKLNGREFTDAYFLSQSRVIDEVSRPTRPITMRPQAAQQWFSTLMACSPDELAFIVNGILWELSERGMSIVDAGRVATVFGPLIDASKSRLQDELERHRDLVAQRYGEDGAIAFEEIDSLDVPFAAEGYFARKSTELEAMLSEREQALGKARAQATLTEKERQELAQLRAIRKAKELQTKQKRRKPRARTGRRSRRRKG